MRVAALIWLACLAIYLEMLWRHRSRGRARGTLPWSLLALIAGGLVTVLWIGVLGGGSSDIEHFVEWVGRFIETREADRLN
jgi:hypothetical protein